MSMVFSWVVFSIASMLHKKNLIQVQGHLLPLWHLYTPEIIRDPFSFLKFPEAQVCNIGEKMGVPTCKCEQIPVLMKVSEN